MFLFEQRWSTLSKIEVLSFLDSFWLLLVENNSFNMNLPSRGVKDFFVIESINLHLKDWGKSLQLIIISGYVFMQKPLYIHKEKERQTHFYFMPLHVFTQMVFHYYSRWISFSFTLPLQHIFYCILLNILWIPIFFHLSTSFCPSLIPPPFI